MNRLKREIKTDDDKKNSKSKLKRNVIIIILILVIAFAVKSAFEINKWQTMAKQMLTNESSKVLDISNKKIAEIGSERKRENVSNNKIPENLKNAYVAIEDERFFKHFGIDIKRTTSAIASYVIHFGNAKYGASTITQQLVKNLTGDDSNSISRKVQEWAKAIELEWCLDKNQILSDYLNIIYVGPNIYGVQMGAKYYFDKDVSELNLTECAFLAGINNAPNAYNPFKEGADNREKIQKRTKIVLSKMYELGYINKKEYENSVKDVDNEIEFKKGKIENKKEIDSYHTDALISEVISDISTKKKISKEFAKNYLYMANLKIYSTQNTDIQEKIETEFEKNKYKLTSNDGKATSQAAMVIIDSKTGAVVGCIGGLGEKTENRGFNRATQAIRQTGSSSKPLTVLAPAIDKGIITPVSQYSDEETKFIDNNNEEYSPTDYNKYLGNITVRRAVESSQNIPFVKMMEQLTPAESIKYLKKMGITTLTERDENLALALGGLDKGISPLEMASAYNTIANDGVYIEPTFYKKITTNTDIEILKATPKKRKVFSKDVVYIIKQLLTQPVKGNNGTAVYCAIPGMDVAAKTGTTNEDYDRWLCGFTNYYTAVTWFGFDMSETIDYNGKNPAGLIWAQIMKNIHKDLENSKFKIPSGVVAKKICKDTFELANSGCKDTYVEYFLKNNIPAECTKHKGNLLQNVDINIDENTKQKFKDVIQDTVKDVKDQINEQTSIEQRDESYQENQLISVPQADENNYQESNNDESIESNSVEESENTEIENNNDNQNGNTQTEESNVNTIENTANIIENNINNEM